MGCVFQIIRSFIYADRFARYDLGSQLGIRREHTMKPDEVEPGPWHESSQTLHELELRHDDVGSAVSVGAFQLQYDIAGTVEFESFIGDGGAGDVAAQLLELVALIHSAAHRGMEAEPLLVGTVLGRLRLKAGTECNAIGTGGRLQRRHGIIGIIIFGESSPPLRSEDQKPVRVNNFMMRFMIWFRSVCNCSVVGARTGWNTGPSSVMR